MDAQHDSLPAWLNDFRQTLAAEFSASVELVETHISWLLLVDGLAYKLKKPIVLSFLDYGSAARRHFFCDEELRLNRRFSPALYLDVVPVKGCDEWALRMRRFDEAGRLDHVCQRGELTLAHIAELVRVIVDFHQQASRADPASRFAAPALVVCAALANFAELQRVLGAEALRLRDLKVWTCRTFGKLRPHFLARKRAACVRECHGDLHLGNLVLIAGEVRLFDCIEFNEDYRWIDVASELAFPYVDLLAHRRPDLAACLLNEWLAATGDYAALQVLRFYAVYRALVRAKVAALRGDAKALGDYLRLAECLTAPPPPQLIITHGLSGSGKTQASSALLLADGLAGCVRLRADVERKRLYGLAANAPSHSTLNGGIYSAAANLRTYAHLAETTAVLLAAGWSVIVDATFLERQQRDFFRQLAVRAGVPFKILACSTSTAALRRRIAERHGDASEATLAVLERQLLRLEPLAADELDCLIEAPALAEIR